VQLSVVQVETEVPEVRADLHMVEVLLDLLTPQF
jgi:hypothetical protein